MSHSPISILPVSLCLTTLNEAATIGDCHAALLQQTALPQELVVCDGGSHDATVALLGEMSIPGCSIRVLSRPGASIARGRNEAIAAAMNDVIAVTDAGCIPEPDWLRRLTMPLLRDPAVMVVGGGYRFGAETPFERVAAAAEIRIEDLPADEFLPSSRSFALRRAAWAAVGGYDETLSFAGEDTDLCVRLRRAGHPIHLELDARVRWRLRPDPASYIRQHILYGIGDGEAGNKARWYAKVLVKHGMFWALAVSGLLHPLGAALLCIALLAYFVRLFRLYRWSPRAMDRAVAAFVLIGVKELSTLVGFFQGSWRRRSTRTM